MELNIKENTKNLSYPERVIGIQVNESEKFFNFGEKTINMGIINCTPDSFHIAHLKSMNRYENAMNSVKKFIKNDFDIIDIGGESTRPSAEDISEDEEINRAIPLIELIRKDEAMKDIIISIDTRKVIN